MNEQRKVIYMRRDQILEGDDLRSAAIEYLAEAVDALIERHCQSAATTSGIVDGLAKELSAILAVELTAEHLLECRATDEMYDLVMAEATAYYEAARGRARPRRAARGRASGDAAHHRPALA